MKKIDPKLIWNYYLSDEFNPILPEKSGFRHYRFKLPNGSWRKVPETINNKESLLKYIIKFGGVDLYYSTSQWLIPWKISTKGTSGTYHVANNIIINNDLVFDFDADEPVTLEGLNHARKCVNNVYEGMKKHHHRFEFDYFAITGHKGFRLAYKDTKLNLPGDPRKRLDYVTENRKIFIEQLLKSIQENKSHSEMYKIETSFDQKITENIMCVVRLLGSVHSTTGIISSKLPLSFMRKPAEYIMNHVPYIGKVKPVIPRKGEMKKEAKVLPRLRLIQKEKDVSGFASLPTFLNNIRYYFTNRVLGIKRGFIPVFTYHTSVSYYKQELIKLQDKYKLGNIYVYKVDDTMICISLKTMQRRQLQKVLNSSSCRTKHSFKKYNRLWVPFAMDLFDILPYKYSGHLSRGHAGYVDPTKNLKEDKYCGWDKIELIRARYEGHAR